jgi:hypothetical protein
VVIGREGAGATSNTGRPLLRPIGIKRQAQVPYRTVIAWLESGHPRAGALPSVNLAASGKRRSYRIRPEDWESFLARLATEPRSRRTSLPTPRPPSGSGGKGLFRY